jgi:1,4-alpha-glucan branching enzyme
MGQEFGQWGEWNEARSLDWHLLQWQDHQQLQRFVADLNHIYQREAALHQVDSSWEGFQWIDISDADYSVISFARYSAEHADTIVVICNFTPLPRYNYRVGLPAEGRYGEVINSDRLEYGGSGVGNFTPVVAEALPWQSCTYSATFQLPPLGVIFLKVVQ